MVKFRVLHLVVPKACPELSSVYRAITLNGSSELRLQVITALLNLSAEDQELLGVRYRVAGSVCFKELSHNFAFEVSTLNHVFTYTNSVDGEWYEELEHRFSFAGKEVRAEIEATMESRRSTSVGDLLVSSGGVVYCVEPVGFQFIGSFPQLKAPL
jgi:hypothetical protein